MWSRLSLRLQIVVILLLVLGAEALLSASWMALVLRKAFVQQADADREVWMTELAGELVATCGSTPTPACVKPLLNAAYLRSGLVGLQVDWAGGRVGAGDLEPQQSHSDAWANIGGWRLHGVLGREGPTRSAASVFQFHLANLLVVVLGLTGLGAVIFNRAVVRPVDQLAGIADRIGHLELDGSVASLDAPMLGQLGSAFERMGRALRGEQARTAAQIAELTRMNRELKEARDSLVRQEKLATVGRLAAGVAHEVGNPLGGILGYAELLKLRGNDPTAQEYGERIGREVARIDQTVRGLLDFSRPAETTLLPVGLPAVVQAALGLCHADRRFRQVEARVEIAADLPLVLADEHRLSQVLVNLLLNAGDAMKGEGQVWVRATLERDERPHRRASDLPVHRIRLTVEDNGPGIPEEVLPRIFDPFFTTKEVGQGTGLGLSICASILDALGGDIRAENRPEGGARFVVHLRAADVPPAAASQS